MDNEEWWWIYAIKSPRETQGYAGRLTEQDCADLYELIS